MSVGDTPPAAAAHPARRLFVYNGGFLTQRRVRRILNLAGWRVSLGLPQDGAQDGECVGVWGNSPTAHRGQKIAQNRKAKLVCVEDAFLRSLFPGRSGGAPLGLLIDERGNHFDPARPSDLEHIIAHAPLDDTALLDQARGAMAFLQDTHLTKYSAVDPTIAPPDPGYVLVIDQTFGDASVRASGADRNRFLEMLFTAREEHPGARILIKTHPETRAVHRPGYFRDEDIGGDVSFYTEPISPYTLLDGAIAVYTVSSQLGFEAIIAGHKPRLFGQPFYAGWGLTTDAFPIDRRQRKVTRAQLFAAAMMLYPKWYDPFRDCLTSLEPTLHNFAADTRAWRDDNVGWTASGMRLWKRKHLQTFFGQHKRLRFTEDRSKVRRAGRKHMVWANKATPFDADVVRVEDGFVRSKGLGAALVPPVSLVCDDLGIYYDPETPSRLETLIRARAKLRPDQRLRAQRLIQLLRRSDMTKYNVGHRPPELPAGQRVLVVGQVEDDASIKLGAGAIATNADLLAKARNARPEATLIYKPHPDVEAGLRTGKIADPSCADFVAEGVNLAHLLTDIDELWTMTSLSGFEALVRGVRVVTTGAPFYAGWGLTEDLGDVPPRRREDVSLEGLVHATLVDYPRYFDPKTGAACSVEVAIERLAEGDIAHPGTFNRLVSKVQGALASQAHWWR